MRAKFNGVTLSIYDGQTHLDDFNVHKDEEEFSLGFGERIVFTRDGDDIEVHYVSDHVTTKLKLRHG